MQEANKSFAGALRSQRPYAYFVCQGCLLKGAFN